MFMLIVNLLFWILIGLWFLGVKFTFQDKIIGICALIIGIVMIL